MGWLFWRSKKLGQPESVTTKKRSAALEADADERADPAQQLRVRARRRLIGAAALLLAVAVIVPMVLDDSVRPVPDSVPIDIPSEKTPFMPRLSLPPVPEPGNVPLAPPPDAADGKEEAAPAKGPAKETKPKPGPAKSSDKGDKSSLAPAGAPAEKSAEKADKAVPSAATKADKTAPAAASKADKVTPAVAAKVPEKPTEKVAEKPAAKPVETTRKADTALAATDEQRAREILEGKSTSKVAAASKATRYSLQAAAPREEADAQELADRLKKAGYTSYVERVEAKDGTRYRVRLGPFASRDEAERVRARLRALDVNASLVAPGT